MAKSNYRFQTGGYPMHSKTDTPYKIPLKDRKVFMGSNNSKWVTKKKWLEYIKWVKDGRPER